MTTLVEDLKAARGISALVMAASDYARLTMVENFPTYDIAVRASYERLRAAIDGLAEAVSPPSERIRAGRRHPTRTEAAEAARVLLLCNGHDLDVWTDGEWPLIDEDGLKLLASHDRALAKPEPSNV